jgi:ADP-glucose pyrophosphorylase
MFDKLAFDVNNVLMLAFEDVVKLDAESIDENAFVKPANVGTVMFDVEIDDAVSTGIVEALRDCTIKLFVVRLDAEVEDDTVNVDVLRVGIVEALRDCTIKLFVVRFEALVEVTTVRFDTAAVDVFSVVIAEVVELSAVIVPVFTTLRFENVLLLETSETTLAKTGIKRLLVVLLVA